MSNMAVWYGVDLPQAELKNSREQKIQENKETGVLCLIFQQHSGLYSFNFKHMTEPRSVSEVKHKRRAQLVSLAGNRIE